MAGTTATKIEHRPSRVVVIHPPLIAAFPILSLLAHNRHETHLSWVVVPVLAAMALAGLLWGLFALFLKDWVKAALPASLAVLLFFSYGHFITPIDDPESAQRGTFLLQLSIGAATALVGVLALLTRFGRPILPTRFANAAAIALLLLPAVSLIRYELSGDHEGVRAMGHEASAGPLAQKPDIYLIIPDAHARADVLRDVYDYDAQPLLSELEAMGFQVPTRSSANYSMTPLSLASMLNLDYLDPPPALQWGDLRQFAKQIRSSRLEKLLRDNGYKTVAFPSAASYSELRHFDEYYHGVGAALGFYRLVTELTPLAVLLEENEWWNSMISDRERLLNTLEELPRIAEDPAPTFTFVHLSLPHPPFQFGEDGQDVFMEYRGLDDDGVGSRSAEAQSQYVEAYRRQVIYTDRRLVEVTRQILARSDSPPVIIIMSDHGPRLNLHWRDGEATDVREVLANFTAVYMPGDAAQQAVYATITPVNVMRIICNYALGTELPLLEDRVFLSTDTNGMHKIADVTSRLLEPAQHGGSFAVSPHPQPSAPNQSPAGKESADQWLAPIDAPAVMR